MTHRTFRQHDQVLGARPLVDLPPALREWVQLNALTSSETTVRRWGRLEPALAGHIRPSDIVDAIDAATPTQTERDAGCVDPAIAGRASARRPGRAAGDAAETACGSRCEPQPHPPTTRGPKTATTSPSPSSGTSWPPTPCTGDRTRSPATSPWTPCTASAACAAPEPDIPLDPTELSTSMPSRFRTIDDPAQTIELSPVADLIQVITWGITRQVITPGRGCRPREVYPPRQRKTRFADAAQTWGITQAAVRQRCSRARRRLTDAVRTELAVGCSPALGSA